MATQPDQPPRRAWFAWFQRVSVTGIAGWAFGAVSTAGLLYAIYWRDHPELTYKVADTRARIVVAGQASALRVFHGETAITTDVTAAQIALWNNGQRAVESGDLLLPLELATTPSVRILEARWRYVTRKVCELALDQSLAAEGELPIRFRILEPQDGGVLEIIYAGSPDVGIGLSGEVKVQGKVRASWSPKGVSTSQRPTRGSFLVIAAFALVVLGVVIWFLRETYRAMRRPGWPRWAWWFVRLVAAVMTLAMIGTLYLGFDALRNAYRIIEPPFAFSQRMPPGGGGGG
jgi:hypothetical protein